MDLAPFSSDQSIGNRVIYVSYRIPESSDDKYKMRTQEWNLWGAMSVKEATCHAKYSEIRRGNMHSYNANAVFISLGGEDE